jgi:hypothetical protein
VEKDKRINGSTLNCPSKRLRRHLWVVLGGYCWRRSRLVSRCRARLSIISCPFSDSSMHQRYINLVYILYLVQLSHMQDPFGGLDKIFWIYTLLTPIKSQHFYPLSPLFPPFNAWIGEWTFPAINCHPLSSLLSNKTNSTIFLNILSNKGNIFWQTALQPIFYSQQLKYILRIYHALLHI